ncbi:hypothetical protein [Spirochaeta lutea]|uniref:DUF4878 domain-containing protein n=1 Tax=Spirochaeta lutea TaxID=1480694 RepID=A0A098QWH0_9SPIO|nr:hypothetical protein [Spirochaeta lutea]KGE72074.1 hypothetical protein DC28_08210 [Spirochaeta lutea]
MTTRKKRLPGIWSRGVLPALVLACSILVAAGCSGEKPGDGAVGAASSFMTALRQGDHETVSGLLTEANESLQKGSLPMFSRQEVTGSKQVGEDEYQVTLRLEGEDGFLDFTLRVLRRDGVWRVSPDLQVTQPLDLP